MRNEARSRSPIFIIILLSGMRSRIEFGMTFRLGLGLPVQQNRRSAPHLSVIPSLSLLISCLFVSQVPKSLRLIVYCSTLTQSMSAVPESLINPLRRAKKPNFAPIHKPGLAVNGDPACVKVSPLVL
jgi:hypothetical protein